MEEEVGVLLLELLRLSWVEEDDLRDFRDWEEDLLTSLVDGWWKGLGYAPPFIQPGK